MSGDLVLDTSVVVAFFRRIPGVAERLERADRLWLPLIALGELEFGVAKSARQHAQRAALDSFLETVDLLPLTAQTTSEYAQVRAALAQAGTPIPENDIWIAAQALEHGWTLATLDAHFAMVPRLRRENLPRQNSGT